MSSYYGNYSQYLGAQRCCNLKTQGFPGPEGPPGPASIGPVGSTGATGVTGPTGGTPWTTMNFGVDETGYTGIGYTGDVMVFGKLYVEGGIDPTYLALEPQPSDPLPPGMNGIWIENVPAKYLHTNSIYLNDGIIDPYVQINPNNNPQMFLTDGLGSGSSVNTSITNGSITLLDETTSTSISLQGGVVTATSFVGDLSGNATIATNIAGGAGGSIPYQSGASTTGLLANGNNGQLLKSNGTTLAPSWIDGPVQATPSVIGLAYGRWDASAGNLGYGLNTLTTTPSNLTNNNNVAVGTTSLNSFPTISVHNRLQGGLTSSSSGQIVQLQGGYGSDLSIFFSFPFFPSSVLLVRFVITKFYC